MISLLLFALLAVQADKPAGSIHGVVTDSETHAAMADVQVRIVPDGSTVQTDAQGRYSFKELAARTYRVSAAASLDGHPGFGAMAAKTVRLGENQHAGPIDLSIRAMGEISGRVLDEGKEPFPDISVFLVTREYSAGSLRYVFTGVSRTDDQGRYRLKRLIPGQGYLVTAQNRVQKLDAVSDVPADPKLRKRAWVPTYYPGSTDIDGAQVLVLRPGEKRDGLDMELARSPSYCIEGVVQSPAGPAAIDFNIEQRRPTSGTAGDGGFFIMPPGGKTGPDGKLRLCNLYPGDFVVTAIQMPSAAGFFGTASVSITDGDVRNVRITARLRLPVPGEVVFEGTAPEKPEPAKLLINADPFTRGRWSGEELNARSEAPGKFSFTGLFVDDYRMRFFRLPDGAYIKDVTYAGASILNQPLRVGSAMGDASLRVVLARDGAVLTAKAADKDGNPVPDSWIYIIPAGVTTDIELADRLISGQTDQDGVFNSKPLAPGKYYVIAGSLEVNKTPESIAKLAGSRSQATEIDLTAGAVQSVTLLPKLVE